MTKRQVTWFQFYMVRSSWINQINTLSTPTDAQYSFGAVLLQSILQHVSATYVAIFGRYKQDWNYNYIVRTIPPLQIIIV
jgi:hypothetical protein